jgi:hypothetical protein
MITIKIVYNAIWHLKRSLFVVYFLNLSIDRFRFIANACIIRKNSTNLKCLVLEKLFHYRIFS